VKLKKLLALSWILIFLSSLNYSQNKIEYPIQLVDLKNVKVTNGFWFNRIETNRKVTIPHVINKCIETGRMDNLYFAAGIKQGEFCTAYPFDDSDVYKTIEAASFSLISYPDAELEKTIDEWIDVIVKVQEKDGYLYSPRSVPSEKIKRGIGPERWSNLQWSHELYVLGHLYEAAAAHYKATGKRTLLDVAIKSADLVINTFNPDKLQIPPGHQEIELGLVQLYELTGNKKYLHQAKYFLDIRGKGKQLNNRESWNEYAQDHKPVIEQDEAVGHAVRAAYMYSAMTDIAALTGDKQYENALDKLWQNVTGKKLYVTGGIGSTGSGEALGADYDLPNMSAYNETCSSIANMMWNFKMYQFHEDGKYLDVFERTLYNAFLSGIGMDGKSFFYPNPLQSYGTHGRTPWFTCACCPPNVARFIASLPSKIYSVKENNIYVNLFASSEAELTVNNSVLKIKQKTNYPWDGNVKLALIPETTGKNFTLMIRIPGWAVDKPIDNDLYKFMESGNEPVVKVNGKEIELKIEKGFIAINKEWNTGDIIELNLPMDIHRIKANKYVDADLGKVALQRGPIVYCAEWPDIKGGYVRNLLLPDDINLTANFESDLFNGVVTINGKAFAYSFIDENKTDKQELDFKAIPYYAWAHRGSGEMSVWIANEEKAVSPLHGPTLASISKVTVSSGKNPHVMNDQIEPKNSIDESVPFFHWWPNKGTTEWVQLDFPEISEVSQVEIFWFDDTGIGECRIPQSWKVFYKEGENWKPVYSPDKYVIEKDKYNSITFETVRTKSLKIEIESQKDFAGGIHEIKIK